MVKIESRAFTLIELILVVTVIIILSAVGIISYNKSKAKAIQKEAIANVRLIGAAERIRNMEYGSYVACSCTNATTCAATTGTLGCNYALKLNLNTTNWTYGVSVAGTPEVATITATGVALSGCSFTLNSGNFDANPTPSGC